MNITNNIVDNMKKIIMIVQNKNETSVIDVVALSFIIEGCQPYASILTMKPSVPGIGLQIGTALVPFLIAIARKQLDI